MKTEAKNTVADDYLNLVRRCPLRVFRTGSEYAAAVEVYGELMDRADNPGLSSGESDYADVLSRLIREYDDQNSAIRARKLSPIKALRMLMNEHGMSGNDLGKLLGSGSGQASLVLSGKRELSKANIRTLADRFKVSAALFL